MLSKVDPGLIQTFASRAHPDKLVSDYPAPNGDGLITAYLAYECYRNRVNEQLDLDGNVTEHFKILDWYLNAYLGLRQRRLPLSARQAAFLNAPLPVLDFACEISVVSHSFIRRERGQQVNLNDRGQALESIYWWCVDRAPAMQCERSLVPDYYVDLMNELDPAQRWLPFHLNYFATRYYDSHPELHFLQIDRKADRLALLAYLVLKCGTQPHLVRFLPRDAISRLFAPLPGADDYIVLDSIIALLPAAAETSHSAVLQPEPLPGVALATVSYFGRASQSLSGARQIRQALVKAIERGGYSLRSGRPIAIATEHFGQCYDVHAADEEDPIQGVALIGAMSVTSGLGQAARMSLKVLERLTDDISIRNFGMDNPAPVGFATESKAGFPDRPRTINLIHLNAESIPLAFAYLPQTVYRNSYNIGFFFWELNRIPPSHRLALSMLDEIWVASEYDREIYSRYTTIPVTNVGMAVEAVPPGSPLPRSYFGLPEGAFVFLTTFDSFSFIERKNPLGAIKAFRAAFPIDRHDVVLVVKTQNRFKVDDPYQKKIWAQITQHANSDPRIVVINETFNYRELLSFKRLCNCYVSLHRSEGWGFGLIEAMQLGVPVIATGYSGNMDFCDDNTCFLVDYDLIGPQPHEYIFVERDSQWAEPRIDSAASHMRTVVQQGNQADSRALAARLKVQTSFSVEAISRRYAERLEAISTILGQPSPVRTPSSPEAGAIVLERKSTRRTRTGHA